MGDLFTRPVCLLGDRGPVPAITDELRGLAGGAAAVLPRFLSVADFMKGVEVAGDRDAQTVVDIASEWGSARWSKVADDTGLQIALYGQLADKGYFRGAARQFSVMREVVKLFHELEDRGARLGEDDVPEALAGEAELVRTLWEYHASDETDAHAFWLRLRRLGRLGDVFDLPLVAVDDGSFPRHITEFIGKVRERQEVPVLSPVHGEPGRFLAGLWEAGTPAPEAGDAVRARLGGTRLVEGEDFEAAAGAAVAEVRRLLDEGHKRIGVVLFDRVLARRAHALAADEGILIEDRSGWISSTLLVGATLLAYCELMDGEATPTDLLDFVSSPGVYFGYDKEAREAAVNELVRLMAPPRAETAEGAREGGRAAAGADALLAGAGTVVLQDLRKELRESPIVGARTRTLHGWIAGLLKALGSQMLRRIFTRDEPAIEIAQMLSSHLEKVGDAPEELTLGQFRAWLSDLMETETISPAHPEESSVSFYSLGQAWLRKHDALVVLGADNMSLPSAPEFVFFNSALREQVGLPGNEETIREEKRRLATLLEGQERPVTVIWPKLDFERQGRQASPLFEMLATALGLKTETGQAQPSPRASDLEHPPVPIAAAEARIPLDLFPRRFGVSSYDMLMACPFRYFGAKVLRLEDEEDEDDPLAGPGYGKVVHGVLQRFNEEVAPRSADMAVAGLEAELWRIAKEVFTEDPGLAGMTGEIGLARFSRSIPELCKLEKERRASGWVFHEAEMDVECPQPMGKLPDFQLRGKVDRVDRKGEGDASTYAVIDYKTVAESKLKESARPDGEFPQIATYAHLLQEAGRFTVEECLLVRVRDRGGSIAHEVTLDGGYPLRVRDRLVRVIKRMLEKASLPANGRESVTCPHCHIRGLCRRPLWRAGGTAPEDGGEGP